MAAIFEKKLPKVSIAYCLDTLGIENFGEIALSPTVKDIEAIVCFATFGKNWKMAAIFEKFAKVSIAYSLDTLGSKISTKLLYL